MMGILILCHLEFKLAPRKQKNQQQLVEENVPLSVAITISLIRVFTQLSEDFEEDWDDSSDDENDKENINDTIFVKSKMNNNDGCDGKILGVAAFDPNIEQDAFYSMNLVNYMEEFFSKCIQQQNEPFKFALSKCPIEQQRVVLGMQQTEQ
eukprot:TRINITY_DN4156_c2_g1_i1.p3 TRINITY_DN4156_c2_g1~~TRINITY_DN4156_c2_g1_i1.p3  ORF type:complete len:151 (-),score=33.30 TRINITY_DN4156_c2_g1_i1:290-742(-)